MNETTHHGGNGSAKPTGRACEAAELVYQLAAAVERAPAVAVHTIDGEGRVTFWNKRCEQLFGIDAEHALGQPLASLAVRLGAEREFADTLSAIWRSGEPAAEREWQIQRHDGRRRWVLSSHFPVMRDGRPQAIICMELDISARKRKETTLALASQVFDNCRDAILVVDHKRLVLAVNPAYAGLTGYQSDEVVGKPLRRLSSGHDDIPYDHLWQLVNERRHWEGELTAQRKDGSSFPVWASLTGIEAIGQQRANYMVILSDITERKRADEQTRHLAEHDYLTDLPNRVLFLDRLRQALMAARRKKHGRVAVMFVDLDRFKGINDSFGHHVGDAVLKEVAVRLVRCVRSADTVTRLGGDEFVVILADIGGVDQAAHVANSVMQSVAQPFVADGRTISLSVSIGVAMSPADGDDVETLLKHADVAMYHAKENGRNAMHFFSSDMNAHVVERAQLEKHLRQALDRQEFELAYLPEIDIASGTIIGVEALIRWRHPQRGMLLPEQFIGVAEECGLMVQIGDWVLRTACARARAWQDMGVSVVVSVNVSALQFVHHDLVASVDAALAASSLAPACLDLEITEAIITGGDERTAAILGQLRERGVRLTVDDFGTGVSSLGELRRMGLSKLKIDRSFVDEIGSQSSEIGIIPAIIALARSLRLRVIAEGVETAGQLLFLKRLGCDEYQGHLAGMASAEPDLTLQHR